MVRTSFFDGRMMSHIRLGVMIEVVREARKMITSLIIKSISGARKLVGDYW
jgi:hypothetical protein